LDGWNKQGRKKTDAEKAQESRRKEEGAAKRQDAEK